MYLQEHLFFSSAQHHFFKISTLVTSDPLERVFVSSAVIVQLGLHYGSPCTFARSHDLLLTVFFERHRHRLGWNWGHYLRRYEGTKRDHLDIEIFMRIPKKLSISSTSLQFVLLCGCTFGDDSNAKWKWLLTQFWDEIKYSKYHEILWCIFYENDVIFRDHRNLLEHHTLPQITRHDMILMAIIDIEVLHCKVYIYIPLQDHLFYSSVKFEICGILMQYQWSVSTSTDAEHRLQIHLPFSLSSTPLLSNKERTNKF